MASILGGASGLQGLSLGSLWHLKLVRDMILIMGFSVGCRWVGASYSTGSILRLLVCICCAYRIHGTGIKGSQLEVAASLVSALASRIHAGIQECVDAASLT